MRWSIPYEQHDSKWLPATSTINFCEEDYYLTGYVAEALNVATNSIFLYLAYVGVRNAFAEKLGGISVFSFIGYSIIGIGSILFHSTLKYPMQLIDELAMIYTTLISCFATFSYGRTQTVKQAVGVACVVVGVTVTAVYHYLHEPIFHQTAFAILMISMLLHSMYLMERRIRPRNHKALVLMWQMVGWGSIVFIAAFGLWNVDNVYCGQLRQMRRKMGMPWGFLLELHAIWHIGTGVGAYYLLIWGQFLRKCLDGHEDVYVLIWPSVLSFPYMRLKSNVKDWKARGYISLDAEDHKKYGKVENGKANVHANGYTNGHTAYGDLKRRSG